MLNKLYKQTNAVVIYRNIKYPRIELKTGVLKLILPRGTDPKKIVEKHRRWILNKKTQIEEYLKKSKDTKLTYRSDKYFHDLIEKTVQMYAKELNLRVNKIFYRKMTTKWASCSRKANMNINKLMRYLPKKLIRYIVYHELIHCYEKRHNKRFWDMISRKFKNYKQLELKLFSYWFVIIDSRGA